MQTFLPYASFYDSARCLDNKRLGKQRVETKQILMALCGETLAWRNHPAVRMWEGYPLALCVYGTIMCAEWRARGFKDTLQSYFSEWEYADHGIWFNLGPMPEWMGYESFHASHRSNLLRKHPSHYGQFGWKEPADLPYVWPV